MTSPKYITLEPITFDRPYKKGEALDLPESSAQELLSLGAIALNPQTEKQGSKGRNVSVPDASAVEPSVE